jgi:catechol 2,3-dioxygenase-like lactoylglutathione lyase family enzyme
MTELRNVRFNILCKNLRDSVAFYRALADFETKHEGEWYVVLGMMGHQGFELGLIDQISEFAPRHAWGMHEGAYLTLIVDNVFTALQRARDLKVEIIEEPVALDYGQTRALIRDPNGLVIDLSTPTAELAARGIVVPHAEQKTTAIDQRQAEERDSGRTSLSTH